ncbi:PEP-CTERM sorting domain-containing protein [Verrucomicrobiaceae bacterium N1E253]|uniref:PEP-CTERM sorting domain-containing protein n=1 Tax=Oceaniferula marina TaxID=2748318 RepID=A0A851GLJ4_9BACT|nr:PEP-CTERM sorting domain-containing protein [Oceaniferula marina]NWK55014.1 PEP-CTERM sorting domain-containing protein [Oceaniferula marina]
MKTKYSLLTATLAAGLCATASAAAIAVNFSENSSNQSWTSSENIGILSILTDNFNSTNNPTGGPANTHTGNLGTGTLTNLVDSNGVAVVGSTLTWSSSGPYYNGAGTGSNEARLNVGYLDDGGGGINIELTNVPYTQYNVYIQLSSDQGQPGGYTSMGFDVNGNGFGPDVLGYNYLGSDGANTSYTEATPSVRGNYILVTGQTASTLTIQGQQRDSARRGSIGAIYIEQVPEPSAAALLGLGGLALILRRRK